ncbi:hypothetical protein TRAPUB_6898 [Trametes pubescens]|uniref:Uncharacterized protein n=1 Tax=Trametes pubescens TaxID=154538 RepID=A0A1M2V4Z3_TRAPU|nr:hypothetical protein TRAPUB_6898 [Trametes pubescens]
MEEGSPLSEQETAALGVYFGGGSWPARMQAAEVEWTISTLYSIIEDQSAQRRPECPDEHRLLRLRGLLIGNVARREVPLANVFLRGERRVLGTSRARKLDLNIRRPPPLYSAVLKINEQVTFMGHASYPKMEQQAAQFEKSERVKRGS